MTDATLTTIAPADDTRSFVVTGVHEVTEVPQQQVTFAEAELPDWVNPPFWEHPLALPMTFIKPRSVFRSVDGSEWRVALAIVLGAALLRTVALLTFAIGSDATTGDIAVGAATSLFAPLLFVAVVTALLYAVSRGKRQLPLASAFSLASLTAAPIVLRAVVQGVATFVAGRPLHPLGLVGFLAPDAPAPLLFALAPVDVFGLWSLALVIVALWVTLSPARNMETVEAEAPIESASDPVTLVEAE